MNINQEVSKVEKNRFLEFSLGNEKFAIPLLNVREVIAVPELTKVPFTPDYYLGVMNLRGQVISIIDLRKRFLINQNDLAETAVIIVDLGVTKVGMVVDSINQVLNVDKNDVGTTPELNQHHNGFITGCYKKDQALVLFLDINQIFDDQHFDHLKEKSGET